VIASRDTAPIEGSASPRNPSERMRTRSSSGSFEVAWRSTASARSSRLMPLPSSTTSIRLRPAPPSVTSMREAPASIAFSTSSLTAAAGRSITSPAAMRLTSVSGRRRIGMMVLGAAAYAESEAAARISRRATAGDRLQPVALSFRGMKLDSPVISASCDESFTISPLARAARSALPGGADPGRHDAAVRRLAEIL
jgi:hypothetical protein